VDEPRSVVWARRNPGDVESSLGAARERGGWAYSGRVSSQDPVADHRAERILAYMVAATVGLSIIAFFAVMIGTFAGVGADDGFSQGIWPYVLVLPMIGLPIGFLLLIALLIVNGVRRSRESRQGAD
jgi:ABC-type dipeptide/oligopeptide/nickel transport system permease component